MDNQLWSNKSGSKLVPLSRIDWQWALNGGKSLRMVEANGFSTQSNGTSTTVKRCSCTCLPWVRPLFRCPPKVSVGPAVLKGLLLRSPIYLCRPAVYSPFSHMWVDFRGINDDFNRKQGFDYLRTADAQHSYTSNMASKIPGNSNIIVNTAGASRL